MQVWSKSGKADFYNLYMMVDFELGQDHQNLIKNYTINKIYCLARTHNFIQEIALRERPDMSDGMKIKQQNV